jgi:hypothetical protein
VFRILDYIFVSIFVIEMLMKIIAFGLVMHKGAYLRYIWLCVCIFLLFHPFVFLMTQIDGFVTLMAVFVLAFPQQKLLSAFRAFRYSSRSSFVIPRLTLRILRLFSKFEGMRVALSSLFKVIPSVITTMVFTSIVWLIFAIVGVRFRFSFSLFYVFFFVFRLLKSHCEVNFFGGQLWYCTDPNVANLSQCNGTFTDAATGLVAPRQWLNQPYDFLFFFFFFFFFFFDFVCFSFILTHRLNFDDVINGSITLFVIASQAGWQEITYPLMDINGIDNQVRSRVIIHRFTLPNTLARREQQAGERSVFDYLPDRGLLLLHQHLHWLHCRYVYQREETHPGQFLPDAQAVEVALRAEDYACSQAQTVSSCISCMSMFMLTSRRIVPPDNFFSRHLYTFLTFHGWFEYFTTVIIVLNAVFLALTWFEEPAALTKVTEIFN